ncbi:hypothetical protein C8R45DRAFT_978569 [Mycena sanguinolenta]|nr:hypothetical protein C8R45DRAFT_978569 [Mycena sanguinolenta]
MKSRARMSPRVRGKRIGILLAVVRRGRRTCILEHARLFWSRHLDHWSCSDSLKNDSASWTSSSRYSSDAPPKRLVAGVRLWLWKTSGAASEAVCIFWSQARRGRGGMERVGSWESGPESWTLCMSWCFRRGNLAVRVPAETRLRSFRSRRVGVSDIVRSRLRLHEQR